MTRLEPFWALWAEAVCEAFQSGVYDRQREIAALNGQCVVTDHSRYGTFLNGHRINGSASLQAGDVIRIGTPGVELRLISVEQ